jgi:hypothetical protein
MFPINISGSIRLRGLGNPAPFIKSVRERLVDMLDAAGAAEVSSEDDAVRFKTAFFPGGPGGNWNILAPFNAGTLQIEAEDMSLRVHYRMSTVRMLLAITGILTLLTSAWIIANLSSAGTWLEAVKIASLAWLWMFGLNYIIAMIRTPLWLKRELKGVAK